MKLLKFDNTGAKVLVENPDDLWYLNTIIDPADIVEGKTFRKIKLGEESDRSQKIIKKPVWLSVTVEKVEFSSDVLRVSGKISEGTDDIPKGSYHTFNVEEGTTINIMKSKWLRFQKDKLDESCRERPSKILIVVMDRDEAHLALMKKYGYEHLTSIQGSVSKKAEPSHSGSDFYGDLLSVIRGYDERNAFSKIIIASPSFWKEDFLKTIKDEALKKKVVMATCGSGDRSAINEVLKREEVKTVLREDRTSNEMKAVEKLLSEISKDGRGAYGIDEVESCVSAGAVSSLLVSSGLITKMREDDTYSRLDMIMRNADSIGADVFIISSEHEGGQKLDGLGGIGAILRYRMSY